MRCLLSYPKFESVNFTGLISNLFQHNRLYHKQYPWPDVITHVANRCCSRLSRMTFRRQPPPAAHFDFHSHRMVTDASSNYSNGSNLLELRVPPPNFSNTGDPAEQLQDLERYFRELREAREASFCSNKSRCGDVRLFISGLEYLKLIFE